MDEDLNFSSSSSTDGPSDNNTFDYIPEGDSSADRSPISESYDGGNALDYNGGTPEDPEHGAGMDVTTYGQHPFGIGAGGGYRPHSQARTDDQPLGSPEAQRQAGMQQPSNASIDPQTIYDRSSYEHESGDVVGAGVFDMPEGVTWNANDGVFANNYAMPEYLAREAMMHPSQSAMIDSQTGLPTVVQPSASGIQLSMEAPPGTRVFSPFAQMGPQTNRTPVPRVPYAQTPRGINGVPATNGAIETFGQEAAVALIRRAAALRSPQREQFVARAMSVLGPERARVAGATIGRLMQMGYPSSRVVEQVFAHGIMHAIASEMTHVVRTGQAVPPMQSVVRAATAAASEIGTGPQLAQAARRVVPALTNAQAARGELSVFSSAPVRQQVIASLGSDGMGTESGKGNIGVLIAGGIGIAALAGLTWKYRKDIFGK